MTQHSPTATQSLAPQGALLGIFAVLGAAALWGTTGTAATFAPEVGPLAMGAAALGIGGSAILCLAKMQNAPAEVWPTIAGIIVGLVAGTTYALYSWSAHNLIGRTIGRAAAMGAIFGLGGLALMPVLIITGAPLIASTQSFTVGAYMALVPMFVGYLLFGYGLTRVSASTATTLTLAEPAIAAILAVVIVGERLAPIG
ncbi:EamA family transporter [Corynebacterium casei]